MRSTRWMKCAFTILQLSNCVACITVVAIPGGIDQIIDDSRDLRTAKQLLGSPEMHWLRCANPAIIGDVQLRPGLLEGFVHALYPGWNIHLMFPGSFRDMWAVLVKPYAEVCIASLQAMVTRNYVSRYFFERVPDMRRAIRVVNRSCDVIGLVICLCFHCPFPFSLIANTKEGRKPVAYAPNSLCTNKSVFKYVSTVCVQRAATIRRVLR